MKTGIALDGSSAFPAPIKFILAIPAIEWDELYRQGLHDHMNKADTAPRLLLDAPPALDGPSQPPTGFEVLFDATPTPILVLDRETLQRVWILRNHLADMNSQESMEFLQTQIRGTKTNEEFLISMNS